MPSKKPDRVPVGRGADAFFGPATEEEASQDAVLPVNQQTSKPVEQNTVLMVNQYTNKPEEQDTGLPVEQEAGKPVFMKATYYITPEQDLKLEQIRLARRERGQRVDKSALIREAINLLVNQ
jgi:hypothetical protein